MSGTRTTLVEQRDNVAIYRNGPAAYAAFRRVSWGAVIAGAVTALAVLTLLNLLGLAIGMSTINPAEEANPLAGLGTGTLIWFALSNLVALFAGGWVAGRLAGFPKKSTSMTHGFLSWAVFAIFSFWVASSAVGSIFNTVGNTLSRTAGLAADAVQSVAGPIGNAVSDAASGTDFDVTLSDIRREADALLEDTDEAALDPDNYDADAAADRAGDAAQRAARNPGEASDIVTSYIERASDRASNAASAVDKEAVASVIAERRNMSEERAMEVVDGWDRRLDRAYAQAQTQVNQTVDNIQARTPEVAGDIASGVAKAALFAFVGLLLGALAAAFGGASGRQLDAALPGEQAVGAADV